MKDVLSIISKLAMVAMLATTITFYSCDNNDDDGVIEPQTIVEIAASNPDFSILVDALERTNLDDVLTTGSYTVFAPTNAAFNALGVDLSTLSDQALSDILLYHVLGASVASDDILEGQTYVGTASTAAPGSKNLSALIERNGTAIRINNAANVTSADLEASNGVIHVIDAVLLPLDIVGHAAANSNFSTLVSALGDADGDLVTALQADGPLTVFAPLNSAFASISETVASLTPAQLAQVLTYHVVAGSNVVSGDLSNGMMVTTLNGDTFTVNIANDTVTITDTQNNTVNVVLTDVQGTNGVIHVLDGVIIPNL